MQASAANSAEKHYSVTSISQVCACAMLLLLIVAKQKYEEGVVSDNTMFKPNFVKNGQLVQMLKGDTRTNSMVFSWA
jgi:hypothetical protein